MRLKLKIILVNVTVLFYNHFMQTIAPYMSIQICKRFKHLSRNLMNAISKHQRKLYTKGGNRFETT